MSDPHSNSEITTRLKHFTRLRDFLDALDHMNDLHEVRREVDTDHVEGRLPRGFNSRRGARRVHQSN